MIINKSGIAIRMAVADLRVMGRATQGVKLINLKGNDSIAAVAKVMKDEEEDIEDIEGEVIESELSDDQDSNEDGTAIDNNETEN